MQMCVGGLSSCTLRLHACLWLVILHLLSCIIESSPSPCRKAPYTWGDGSLRQTAPQMWLSIV